MRVEFTVVERSRAGRNPTSNRPISKSACVDAKPYQLLDAMDTVSAPMYCVLVRVVGGRLDIVQLGLRSIQCLPIKTFCSTL